MRNVSLTDKHFLKDIFAQWQSEISQTERLFASVKDAAEIAAIFLIYAFLLIAASFWTLKFLGLIMLLLKQFYFVPFIFEETNLNLDGFNESVFIESVFLNF